MPADGDGNTGEAREAPRHFLDLRDFDTATLRQMLDMAARISVREPFRRVR